MRELLPDLVGPVWRCRRSSTFQALLRIFRLAGIPNVEGLRFMKVGERGKDWLALLISIPIFALTWHFSSRYKAVGLIASILLLYVIISSKWYLRKNSWFWICLFVLAVVHFTVVFITNFTIPRGPSLSYVVPLVFADGLLMYWLVSWLEKRLPSKKS